jgi:hypothetical protein
MCLVKGCLLRLVGGSGATGQGDSQWNEQQGRWPAPSVSLDYHLLAQSGEQFVLIVTACVLCVVGGDSW